MKVKSMMAALLLLTMGVQTMWAQKMVVTMADDSKVVYDIVQVKDVTFEEAEEHDWVDLGLPSGTLWATCNVGANSPEEYGDYFAWGETEPKNEYNMSTYKWCKGSDYTMTKYCQQSGYGYNGFTDNLTELLPEDDAATANWGSGWQMPSIEQCEELTNGNNTTTEGMTLNDVIGLKITGKNGNSIFLPATGYRYGTTLDCAGALSYYWSRSLDTDEPDSAHDLYVGLDWFYRTCSLREFGQSVRPVRVQQ